MYFTQTLCPGRDSNPYDPFESEGFKPEKSVRFCTLESFCSGLIWVFVPSSAVLSVWWVVVVAGPVHLLCTLGVDMACTIVSM